jgi:hypothetical protein
VCRRLRALHKSIQGCNATYASLVAERALEIVRRIPGPLSEAVALSIRELIR